MQNDFQTLVFGDSFAGIFTLLRPSARVKVVKFKGGTAKGLTKEGHENKATILNYVKNNVSAKCCIFSFGQVDIHLSFYFDLVKKGADGLPDHVAVASKYVDFVASIPGVDKKIILAVYPTPVPPQNVKQTIIAYARLSKAEIDQCPAEQWSALNEPSARVRRLDLFNDTLKQNCEEHGIQFASINDQITDGYGVRPEFQDLHLFNIHLRWEPLMLSWVEYFNDHGITKENLEDLSASESKYVEYKKGQMSSWDKGAAVSSSSSSSSKERFVEGSGGSEGEGGGEKGVDEPAFPSHTRGAEGAGGPRASIEERLGRALGNREGGGEEGRGGLKSHRGGEGSDDGRRRESHYPHHRDEDRRRLPHTDRPRHHQEPSHENRSHRREDDRPPYRSDRAHSGFVRYGDQGARGSVGSKRERREDGPSLDRGLGSDRPSAKRR